MSGRDDRGRAPADQDPPREPSLEDPSRFDRPSDAGSFSIAALALTSRDRLKRSRFARDVGSLWSAQLLALGATVVQGLVVARILGPRSYGVVGLIVSVPALVYVFLDARSADASVRYLGEFSNRGELERARAFCKLGYLLDATVGLLSFVAVIALGPWAERNLIHEPKTAGLLVVYAAGMALRSPAVTSNAALVTFGRFRRVGALQVLFASVRGMLVIGAVIARPSITSVVWASAAGLAVEGMVSLAVATSLIRRTWGGSWVGASLSSLRDRRREIARFLFWSDVGGLLGLAAKQVDVLAVGYFADPTAAGYYRVAVSIASLGAVVVAPLQSVLFQRFAKLRGAGDGVGLDDIVRRSALVICLPLGLLGFLTMPFVPLALRVAVGSRYLPAAPAARILLAASAIWLIFAWVRPLALTMGAVKLWAFAGGLVAVASLAGFALITPDHGFVGTAWVRFAVGVAMQAGIAAVMLRRYVTRRFAMIRPIADPPS